MNLGPWNVTIPACPLNAAHLGLLMLILELATFMAINIKKGRIEKGLFADLSTLEDVNPFCSLSLIIPG